MPGAAPLVKRSMHNMYNFLRTVAREENKNKKGDSGFVFGMAVFLCPLHEKMGPETKAHSITKQITCF
jgi:hypothetical protein